MRKFNLLKTMFLLCALVVGSTSVWADDEPQWSYTIATDKSNIALNTSTKTFTATVDDEDYVWSYTSSTVGSGTPGVTVATDNSMGCLKFGSKAAEYFSTVVLTTDAFEDVAVTKVHLYLRHNGKKTGSLTVKQGDITIGTADVENSNTAKDVTCSETKKGEGGTLTISYSVAQALYIYKIEVWYEDLATSDSWKATYKYNDGGVTPNKVVEVLKTEADSYTLEAAPTRTNYTFLGWSDGTNTYDGGAAYALSANTNFTAQWKYSGPTTTYTKVSKNDIATGAKYVLVGSYTSGGTTTWEFATAMSGNTYLHASEIGEDGTLNDTKAIFTEETPEVFTLKETAEGWTMTNAGGQKIGLTGDKKLGYDNGDMTWDLGGTDEVPTLSATYDSKAYIMKMNWNSGDPRFNAYTSGQQTAYFYRLDNGKDVYTLTLNFNDGATPNETHRVLEDADYTLTAPTRAGYVFLGWNTAADGTGTNYAAGAYTMPAGATTLYAVWGIALSPAKTYTTLTSAYALDFTNVDGLHAYIVKEDGVTTDKVTMTEVNKVPAGTGLVIRAETIQAYNVPVLVGDADDVTGNKMEGSATTTTDIAADAGYILKDGAFHPSSGNGSLAAGKAYLHVAVAGSRVLTIDIKGETTDIDATLNDNVEMTNDSVIYDLQGRRVDNNYRGIVIKNGKKVVIK